MYSSPPVSAPSRLFCLLHPVLNCSTTLHRNLSVPRPPSLPPAFPLSTFHLPAPLSVFAIVTSCLPPPLPSSTPQTLLQSDAAPYLPLMEPFFFFAFFSPSLCQFVSLPVIIASLHKPAHTHFSFSLLLSLPPILISPTLTHSLSLIALSPPILLLFLLHIWLIVIDLPTHSFMQFHFSISYPNNDNNAAFFFVEII